MRRQYSATQREIIERSKVVEKLVDRTLPHSVTSRCSLWKKSASGMRHEQGKLSHATSDVIISEFPDMPKVMDALGLLPERFYAKDKTGAYEPYDITVIPADELSKLSRDELDAFSSFLNAAIETGVVPLLDERSSDAPLCCIPGSYEKIHGHHYTFNKADIQLLATDIVLDEEIAYSLLRHELTLICRSAYADLVPRQKGKQKKSYKMKAVGRCCEFATLLSCGRDDFSDFKQRAAHETDRARVLTNVRLTRENFPDSLHEMYDKIRRLEDVTDLWRAACIDGNKDFIFNFADIDEGVATEKMDEIAEALGIDSFFDAWEAGVPVEDISA